MSNLPKKTRRTTTTPKIAPHSAQRFGTIFCSRQRPAKELRELRRIAATLPRNLRRAVLTIARSVSGR